MHKTKVLIALYSLTCGGGEKALVNMLNSLDPQKYDITLQLFRNEGANLQFVPQHVKLADPLFPNGFPSKTQRIERLIKNFDLAGIVKSLYYYIKSRGSNARARAWYEWKSVEPFCKRNQEVYDVAVAAMHGLSTYYVFDTITAKRKICWIHTDFSKISKFKQEQQYFESANNIVTVSEQCYNSFKSEYPMLNNVVMLYNLNCPDLIKSMANQRSKDECFPDNFDWHFLSIGRIIALKGFDMLVDAANGLKSKGVSFAWYILGQGNEEHNLKDKAKALGVDDRIFFIGIDPNPYPYIKHADIIVQTSRYEGKSMVLDEAKILNKPIVSTSYDSVYDQIEHKHSGYIVPISSKGIENGIYEMITNSQLMNSLSEKLSKTENRQDALIKDYDSLLEGKL